MFCTSCGKEVADGSMFCTSCGARMTEDPVGQETPAVNPDEAANTLQSGDSADITPADASASTPATPPTNGGAPVPNTGYIPSPVGSSPSFVPPKKSNTGIILAIAGIAFVVIMILIFSGGSKGGYDNYKDLVTDYYDAVYNEDVNAIIKMHEKDFQKDLNKDKKDVAETLEDMKSDLDDEYGKKWNKDVEVDDRKSLGKGRYKVYVEIDGDTFELYIIKDDGKYYIDEDESAFD